MVLRRRNTQALGRAACAAGALLAALGWLETAEAAKIACVGDSITYGYNLSDPSTQSYPALLAMRLGSADTVQNFGVSGTTLLKSGDKPYWNEANFSASTTFAPDVVIIMLGTNDAKPQNWANKSEFSPDYLDLIAHYRSLGALVYVATPPPVYAPGAYSIPPDVVANEVVPLVETIASQAQTPLVDVFTALSGKPDDFPDTVHPNAVGAALIADTVQAALGMYGLGGATMTAGAGGVGMAGGAAGAASGGRANAGRGGSSAAGANNGGVPSSGGMPSGAGTSPSGAGGTATSNGGSGAFSGRANGSGGRGGSSASASGGAGDIAQGGGTPGAAGVGVAGALTGVAGSPAGAREPASTPSGGSSCGCRVGSSEAPARGAAVLALALVAFWRRRR